MDTSPLIETVRNIIPLSSKLEAHLNSSLKLETYPKRHLLLEYGQVARRIYYIKTGFARAYYHDGNKEQTTWFMGNGDFMISVYSFFTQKPAVECIELLEETTLLSISWTELQEIYREFFEFNIVGRVLTEKYYMISEERAILLRTATASERYQTLIKQYPHIMQKAKLGQIASYLSISQETLSRIRANKF